MGGKGGGGGTSTSVTDVPHAFKPAYFRLFNSALAASEQAAGVPPSMRGQPNYQPQQGGQQAMQQPQTFQSPQYQNFLQQGMQQYPQIQQQYQGQPSGQPQGFLQQQSSAQGGQQQWPTPTNGLQPGQYPNPNVNPGHNAGDRPYGYGLPEGYTQGSKNIPYSGGPPIVGAAFPGQFTAPTTAIEQESLANREAVGRQLGGLGNNLLGLGQAQAGGAFLNPYSNPYFSQNLQASLAPAMDAFQRGVMPQFNSQAINSGAFKGSSARDFAMGNLANDFGRNLLNTAGQVGMQNYGQERQIQQQTPQMLQQAAALQQMSPEILAQVGAGQRELMQRPLDEALLQFQEYQQAPFRPLGPLASIIQGTNIGTTDRTTVPRPSPLASGITGALGGGALGLGLANAAGYGGGWGGAASGGLGALLGGLAGGLG